MMFDKVALIGLGLIGSSLGHAMKRGKLAKNIVGFDADADVRVRAARLGFADAIAATSGTTKADARKLVDGVLTAIAEAAAKGQEISLNGFGKFKIKDSPAREGRNPSTGETIQIAASKKLTFTPAKALKDKLNG